ncbi:MULTISPECIES: hypothetical protein [unclassified Schlesneria]|uniref:hypothetical protein n=1 Tax=Schlesneria TaxID=656899 RepID=UPI002EE7BC47
MTNQSPPPSGVEIKETGLAIVHKGEFIFPAAGSQAVLQSATGPEATVVNYYFPIEIVLVGDLSEQTHQEIQSRIWEKLGDALERSGS